jgi:hypothetical protein
VEHVAYWGATLMRDVRGLGAPRVADTGPQDVNLEPTNLCNANCVFCGYQFQERPHTQLSVETGYRFIDAAKRAGISHLGLTPMVGDPLIHRRLEDLIRHAKAAPNPMHVGFTTNAILLTLDRYRSLVEAGLDVLDISMSYPDDAEYRRVYRSAKLKTVVSNIEQILALDPRETCKMSIGVRTPRRDDWHLHPLFVRARERGWQLDRNHFFDDWSGTTSDALEAEGLWTRPLRPKHLPCAMTYAGPHIMSDGRATACGCRDVDGRSELALSPEALLEDMRGVYAEGEVKTLRARFREGTAPEICQTCRHYNPQFAGEPFAARFRQLGGDALAAARDLLVRTSAMLDLRDESSPTPEAARSET